MRYIQKKKTPSILEELKRKNRNFTYKSLEAGVKQELKVFLLEEQETRCCYCEKGIDIESKSSHIEHLKPQSLFPKDTLDYQNLLASCCHKDSCGFKKENWYCEDTFIHPLREDCSEHFKFLANGEILGITELGEITVQRLGLNCKNLQNTRKSILNSYRSLSVEEIHQILDAKPSHSFISAIQEVFELYR
jgi:uncharacterized protein (TIGR02646 family)